MDILNHEQELMQTVAQMKASGMSEGMINSFIGRIKDASQQEMQSLKPSQSDRVIINKSDPDASGVYIDSRQVAQDLFANAVAQGQDVTPRNPGAIGGPPRATDLSVGVMAAGNPNYTVAKPTRTTVNDQGHIVTY